MLLSCKAYSLDDAIDSFAPLVGESTLILPMLNGMRHIDVLTEKFGASRVLGGQCVIAATLNAEQHIVHLNDMHAITFGELAGGSSERVQAIAHAMADANFDVSVSDNILLRMWEKWVFLATLAASTCLMRGSVGDILAAPDGKRVIENLLGECRAVAEHNGFTMGHGLRRARYPDVVHAFAADRVDAARRRKPLAYRGGSHSRRSDRARRRRAKGRARPVAAAHRL